MRLRTVLPAILALATMGAAPAADDAKPQPERTVTVKPIDLPVVIEHESHLEAVRLLKLKLVPEELAGPFTVSEILASGRSVEAGTLLARFDTERTERRLRAAREAVGNAQARVRDLREDLELLTRVNRQKAQRLEQDLARQEREREAFTRFGEEQWLKGRALDLRQRLHKQANLEDELTQLDKMYRESTIAGDTKDIVLERTRREVEMGKEGLELARRGEQMLKEFEHPLHVEKLQRDLERLRQDLEVHRAAAANGERQKALELAQAERGARDTEEHLDRLGADLARLTVAAPFAGILRHGHVEVGDKVQPNTVFAELIDPARFEIRLQLSLKEVQQVKPGDRVQVRIPDLPLMELGAVVEDVARTATFDGPNPRWQVKAVVDADPQLRLGTKVRAEIRGPVLKDAITILRSAITYERGRYFCRVKDGDGTDKREILLGSGDRERVQVLKGLAAGDVVVVKDAKE